MSPIDAKTQHGTGKPEENHKRVVAMDAIAEEGLEFLRGKGFEVIDAAKFSASDRRRALRKASAILVRSSTRVDRELLDAAPALRAIARAGVGLDTIDLEEATRRKIVVFNTPGGNAVAAAELSFALLLALARKLVSGHLALSRGEWERQRYVGFELAGKKLGVVGVGRIGTLVARRAQAFEMEVLAHDPFLSDERAVAERFTKLGLDDLLRQADLVTLHLPLSEETRGLIGARELALMKKGSVLVNCARGGLVEESALTKALQSGHLAGAALDVYQQEPPAAGNPLLSMEQVVHTPHLGASTQEAKAKVGLAAARLIAQFLGEGRSEGAVNLAG